MTEAELQAQITCIYNRFVTCCPAWRNCQKCGWNPKVQEERIGKLKERRAGNGKSKKADLQP